MASRTGTWSEAGRNGLGYLALAAAALSLGCGAPSEQPQVSQQASTTTSAAVKSPISINAAMVRLVDHSAHQLWNVEKDGMAPKTDADWENLEEHAAQMALAGALIRIEGTGVNDRDWVQRPDWQKWATAVSDAGMAASKAVEARNLEGLVAANGQLTDACESCHKQFKPELPSEGIMHSHLH